MFRKGHIAQAMPLIGNNSNQTNLSAGQRATSALIGAWKCNFPALLGNYDRQTDRQTNRCVWGWPAACSDLVKGWPSFAAPLGSTHTCPPGHQIKERLKNHIRDFLLKCGMWMFCEFVTIFSFLLDDLSYYIICLMCGSLSTEYFVCPSVITVSSPNEYLF